jgi:hypothetical protein
MTRRAIRLRLGRAVAASAVALAGCTVSLPFDLGPYARGRVDASPDGAADADGPDVQADADLEADLDADGQIPWTPGPVTLVVDEVMVLGDRLCDLDGDGDLDNAIADLGPPYSELYPAAMTVAIQGSVDSGFYRFLLHMPWVEESLATMQGEVRVVAYKGLDVDCPRDAADDFTGDEEFYAMAASLDACGEPLFSWPGSRVEAGRLLGTRAPIAVAYGDATFRVMCEVAGRFGPDGRSLELDVCARADLADLGADFGDGLTVLEALLGGGARIGFEGPGLQPDVDRDGDGLERFTLDDQGRIARCIDGDGTPIEGRDCSMDPRMADGFALSLQMHLASARYGGREPGWELMVPGRCDGGPPAPSAFGDVVHQGACAHSGERCDPLAVEPCCDPDRLCRGMRDAPYLCTRRCALGGCPYGTEAGLCHRGDSYPAGTRTDPPWLCHPIDNDVPASDCEPGTDGCTTEYGVTEGTECVTLYAIDRAVCLESCEPLPFECDVPSQMCAALLVEDGGFCYAPP